ncbi:hypothetical protein ACJMK2_011501 [Sinanodonta woodiana]|uniref:ARF GTPase-activating protein GIT2 n=1 Tax=Sinanodonta woodiana TaxID=1069815 RepID=A0ABD3V596_SINWO
MSMEVVWSTLKGCNYLSIKVCTSDHEIHNCDYSAGHHCKQPHSGHRSDMTGKLLSYDESRKPWERTIEPRETTGKDQTHDLPLPRRKFEPLSQWSDIHSCVCRSNWHNLNVISVNRSILQITMDREIVPEVRDRLFETPNGYEPQHFLCAKHAADCSNHLGHRSAPIEEAVRTIFINVWYDWTRAKRESLPATPTVRRALNVSSFTSDDEPLYDSVASDEDYSSVDNLSVKSMKSEDKKMPQQEGQHEEKESTPTPMPTVSENNHTDSVVMEPPTTEHFLEMRRAFIHSQSEVRQLIQANRNLQTEVERLNHMVHALITENSMLKEQQHLMDRGLPNGPDNPQNPTVVQTRTPRQSRPQSMFEPRDHQRVSSRAQKGRSKDDLYPIQSQTQSEDPRATTTSSSTESGSSLSQGSGEFNSMSTYDVPRSVPLDNRTNSAYSIDDVSGHRELSSSPSHRSTIEMEGKEQLPTLEALIGKTEKITKKIQELLVLAQEGKHVCYGPCSEKIHAAVLEMAALFPQKIHSESVKYALHLLTTSADQLKDECAECQPCSSSLDNEEPPFDPALKTQQVIQCAYDIAKSAKQLVTLFQ